MVDLSAHPDVRAVEFTTVPGLSGGSGRVFVMIDELTSDAVPFRGSVAVQRGLVSRRVLRSHRYRRLFHDVYLPAGAPADLAARSHAATLLAPGQGVLSGYSAAELLGARCAPADVNAELTVPGGDLREQRGRTVHRDLLADDEITDVAGLPITTALRTAWDLARWLPTVGAVVAMDALARTGRFTPARYCRFTPATRERAGAAGCPG